MKITTLFTLLCALVLAPARAGTIAVDPTSGGVAYAGGVTIGWEFEVTAAEGITVDGLAFWDNQADGFAFSQTFPVGLWDPSTGTLLRSTVITSSSSLKPSLHPDGDWRVNPVSPIFLAPGFYRVGALLPDAGANPTVDFSATVQDGHRN